MASSAALDSDIVTDAEPSNIVDNQPSDHLPTQHSSTIKFDKDISLYKDYLPYEIKLDFIDVLIINASGDKEEALKFKSDLENHDTKYSSLGYRKLNVKLLDELWVDPLKHLGFAFKRSFCILLFVTAEFVNDEWPLLKGYACKKKHQRSRKKNNEVLPVHTALEKDRDYELPLEMECDEKPALIYCEGRKGECCKNVGILLGEYKAKILEKERQLYEQRKDFIVKNRDNLEKNLQYFQSLSRSYSETALKEVDSQPSTRSPTLPPREQACPDFGRNFLGGGNQSNMSQSAAHVVRPETLVATPKPGARNVEMCQTAMVMSAQTPSDEPGLEVSIQSDSAYGGSEVTSDNSTDSSHVDEQRGFPEIPNSDNLISDISRVTIDEDSRSDDHTLMHE